MIELSLLIFVIACCHVGYKLIMRLFSRRTPPLPFFIPSAQEQNLAWGFVFYAVAFGLLTHTAAQRNIFAGLTVILLIAAVSLSFFRAFFCGGFCPLSNICQKILRRRLSAKQILPDPMTPRHAAALLGLSLNNLRRELIEQQYNTITGVLHKRRFLIPELQTLLTKAHDTLTTTVPREQ